MPLTQPPFILGSSTWAHASVPVNPPVGTGWLFTNVGTGGTVMFWTGTYWKPLGGVAMLAVNGAPASVTGTLVETTLATVPIPAGLLSTGNGLLIYSNWSYTNSVNSKGIRVYYDTQLFSSPTQTTSVSQQLITRVTNRNSASSQVGGSPSAGTTGGWSAATSAVTTGAIDSTVAKNILFNGLLTNTGETITLESYSVELLVP